MSWAQGLGNRGGAPVDRRLATLVTAAGRLARFWLDGQQLYTGEFSDVARGAVVVSTRFPLTAALPLLLLLLHSNTAALKRFT